jgi:hypothetical protein
MHMREREWHTLPDGCGQLWLEDGMPRWVRLSTENHARVAREGEAVLARVLGARVLLVWREAYVIDTKMLVPVVMA